MVKAKDKSISAPMEPKVTLDLIHIKATRRDKHGGVHSTRRKNLGGELEWSGPREWAQVAIGLLRQQGKLSPDITGPELLRLTREQLDKHSEFKDRKLGRIDDKTIFKAAKLQGVTWRSVRGRPRKG